MHSAKSRGGTPISIAPGQAAQREADWGQTTALSQKTAPCSNAETPHRLEVAHCLYKHCLWLWGHSGQPCVQAAPGLHHDPPHPAASTGQALPTTGQTMPQACSSRDCARFQIIPPRSPESTRHAPRASFPTPQSQPPPAWSRRSCGRPAAATRPPPRSTAHPRPAFRPAHASYGSAHPPPSCS